MQKKEHEGRKEKKLAARLVSFVLPSTTSSRFFSLFKEREEKKKKISGQTRAHTHTHTHVHNKLVIIDIVC